MLSFSIVIDGLVVGYFLYRQRKIRPVPRVLRLQLPIILGFIGLLELHTTSGDHHVTTDGILLVVGTLLVGAVAMGAIRALTVRIWVANNWVVRQGTWLTMSLWLVTLLLHLAADAGASRAGAGDLQAQSFLLYIALTYGIQNYVVNRRAVPLWQSLGPDAGRRLQVNFGQGPAGGAFFTNFGQRGPGYPPPAAHDDPTIIDAEVVDDDEEPPALR